MFSESKTIKWWLNESIFSFWSDGITNEPLEVGSTAQREREKRINCVKSPSWYKSGGQWSPKNKLGLWLLLITFRYLYNTVQGGSTFLFPQVKNSFPVAPTAQESPLGTVFQTKQPVFFIFKNTYSEKKNYHLYAQ